MGYVYSGLVSLAVAMLAFVLQGTLRENRKLKKEKEEKLEAEENALKEGVLCLLRSELIKYHTKYMEEGSITMHGYQNWMLMYKAYKALDGNGMIDHMWQDIEELRMRS